MSQVIFFTGIGLMVSQCSAAKHVEIRPKKGNNDVIAPIVTSTPGVSQPIESGQNVFFSFGKAGPKEPTAKKDFLMSQINKVKDGLEMSNRVFRLDVTLDENTQTKSWVQQKFNDYGKSLGKQDTFVYYSHTHGTNPGIQLDFTSPGDIEYKWGDLAKSILSLPAKNVVIFVMACHSGYLVDALEAEQSKWKGQWASQKRNLVVLTAVASDQESFPTDVEPDSPTSIGNPFSYAVTGAFKGNADGSVDGVKDGKTSYKELVTYVLKTAKEKSKNQYANPKFVGEYSDNDVFMETRKESTEETPVPELTLAAQVNAKMQPIIDKSAQSNDKVPGAVVGIVKGDSTSFFGYGTTKTGTSSSIPNSKTLFSIGSITKTLTGLLLAREVYHNRMILDSKAVDLLPPALSLLDDRITLKHLVSHSSTLKSMPENIFVPRQMEAVGGKVAPPWWSPAKAYSFAELSLCLKNGGCKPSATPGSQSIYSNLGLGLLGMALETKLGYQSYNSMVVDTFGKELKMYDTQIPDSAFQMVNNDRMATGYCNIQHEGQQCNSPTFEIPELAKMGILEPSGGLVSTAEDMARLLKVLMGTSPSTDWKQTAQLARAPLMKSSLPSESTAYGFNVLTLADGSNLYLKIGETAGHTSMMVWSPQKSIGIVILTNRGYLGSLKQTALDLFDSVSN